MGDALKKVTSGSPLAIPAAAYNAFIDAARAEQAHQGDQGVPGQAVPRESGIVLIKNTTESDLERFAILGIDSPIFTPTDNEQEFKNRVALKGVTPDTEEDEHYGRFAILLEPLAAGNIGLGMVQGVTPVRLRRYTDWLRSADIQDGKTAYLCDKIGGIAKILWCEEGISENEEDLKWAVVALRGGGGTAESSYVWRAQVTGVYAADGGAWVSYAADGWQAYVTANPLYQNGEPDEETTLLLKLTADCAEGEVGFKDVAGGDKIGYIIATDTSDVPGQPSGTKYDGWVILHGEDDGATLAALQHAKGGPGITVDDTTDPFEPKIRVELAAIPGLKFDVPGDDGKLQAKANAAKAVVVEAAGIGVVANTAKAIVVDGSGVGVVANTTEAIAADGNGVKWTYNTSKGLGVENNLAFVKLKADGGLVCDAAGVYIKVEVNGPLTCGANGLDLGVANLGGLTYDDSGNLKAHIDTARGIYFEAGKIAVDLDTTNLEFDSGKVKHKQNVSPIYGVMFRTAGDPPHLEARYTTDPNRTTWSAWYSESAGYPCIYFDGAGHQTNFFMWD